MARRGAALLVLGVMALAARAPAQKNRQTARDLFYSEAGLMASPEQARKGRFAAARNSTVSVVLGLKYRFQKLAGGQAVDVDPEDPFRSGDQVRLIIEINDTGYLYVVHRQPGGLWRRLFPDPEIEHGNHFVHSGVAYPIPPEEGLELKLAPGPERIWVVLARAPLKDLDVLVSPRQPEGTVSALPTPEISDAVLDKVRTFLIPKDLLTERIPFEKAVYIVNRSGQSNSLVATEIRLADR
jgi:hypothetical protein